MRNIGEILIEMGFVDVEDVNEGLAIQGKKGGKLGDILTQLGYVTPEDILFALAEQTGMEVADLDEEEIEQSVIDLIPKTFAVTYRVVPVGQEGGVIVVALGDPMNPTVLEDLRFMLNLEVRGAVATPDAINRAITRYYGAIEETTFQDALAEAGFDPDDMEVLDDAPGGGNTDLEAMTTSTPVVKLVNRHQAPAPASPRSRCGQPHQDHGRPRHRRDAPPPGRAHRAERRGQARRYSRLDLARGLG